MYLFNDKDADFFLKTSCAFFLHKKLFYFMFRIRFNVNTGYQTMKINNL